MFRFGEWNISLVPSSRPVGLVVELTTRCSLSCTYCFRNVMTEPQGDMDAGTFRRVVEEAEKAGVNKIVLTGWGEPTQHPQFQEFVELLGDRGFRVVLNTNGITLGDYLDLVLKHVQELYVSVDIADGIMRGAGRGTVWENLRKLADAKVSVGGLRPIVSLVFLITAKNYMYLPKVIDLASEVLASRLVINNLIPISREFEELTCINNAECLKNVGEVLDRVSKQALTDGVAPQSTYVSVKSFFACPFVDYGRAYVAWDGEVSPCMFFSHSWRLRLNGVDREVSRISFGNVSAGSLLNIWRRHEYHSFRFRVRTRQMASCLDCELEKYCSYTRNNTSDCYGNKPSCSFCPYSKNLAFCPT